MARKSSQDQSSAGIIVETLMKEARERVACDFLEACEGDEAKRAVVLELCKKVFSNEQYSKIVSAKRSEEDDSEIDEQDDNGNDESDGSGERDEGSSDDSSIPTMKDIKGKPYQDGISAETGELPFEEFEDLFEPDGNQQENQKEQMCRRKPSLIPNKDAIRLFGAEAAKKLVNWHHHVKHSGQLYSEEWLEGRIRDQNLGTIAKPMLLICLQHIKISRAPTAVLGKICHDLELQSLIKKALEVWGVADRFPRLWARKPADQYARTGDIKMCRQCEIFVARAYVCVTTLKHAAVSDDLGNKLLSCLVDMEKNLPPDLAKKRARRMSKDSPRRNGTPSSPASKAMAKSIASNTSKNTSMTPIGSLNDEKIIQQVCQHTGKVLGEFNSARDIVNRLGDSMNVDYICKVLKGKQKTACNYIWRYKKVSTSTNTTSKARGKPKTKERPEDGRNGGREDEEMDSQVASLNKRLGKSISPTRKEKAGSLTDIAKTKSVTRNTSNEDTSDDTDDECNIEQLSLETGEVLGEFSNVLEIEDRIGHLLNVTSPRSSIFTVLRGVQKSACGFGWRYKKKSTTARNISSQTVSSKETKGGNRADSNKGDTQAASPNMGLDSSMSPKRKEKVASSTDNAKNNLAATNTSNADACDDTDDEGIIEQVSLETGEVLGEFSNVLEVEDRIGHLLNTTNPRKRIKMVLRGVQKSAAGFSWRYKKKLTSAGNKSNQTNKSKETKGDNLAEGSEGEKGYIRAVSPYKRLDKTEPTQQPMKKSSSTLKEVTKKTSPLSKPSNYSPYDEANDDRIIEQVLPDTGEVVGEFSSIRDIENSIGHSLTNKNPKKYIRRVLKGGQISFNGFIWRYKGDQNVHTAEAHRKRKAIFGVEGLPSSKGAKLNSRSRSPGSQDNYPSISALQHLPSTASSRALNVRAIASMVEIKESPYMKEASAEVGEEMFDHFKDLLLPRGSDGRHLEASQQAKDLFGETAARQMVTASTLIAKSGMVYGSSWKDGSIQGKKCGLISKPMLLLCLQEQRLASSSPNGLQIIISDLGVVTILEEALKFWKLGKNFPLLVGMKSLSAIQSRTKGLLGCMIFVARSYRCMIAIKRTKVSDSTLKKVRKCLSIVHDSLEQQAARKKRVQEATQETCVGKSMEPIVQKQKVGSNPFAHTNGVNLSRVDESMTSHEPFSPGIIMHNLFLKPAKVPGEAPKEKPRPATQKDTKLSTPPELARAGTTRANDGKRMEQDRGKKQTTAQPEHNFLQTNQRTQAQPTNRLLQPIQQTPNRPAEDIHTLANQGAQNPVPINSQESNKDRFPVTPSDPTTRAPNPKLPTNAPNPLQSINNVPLPPLYSVLEGPWYPPDQASLLNDAETELAWLTTECSFALRLPPKTIIWPFIWEYSSPLLKKELRQSRETKLEKLVRLHDGFVRDRFKVLKGEIQKELNMGKRRPLMEKIIPLLRHRSRLANRLKKP